MNRSRRMASDYVPPGYAQRLTRLAYIIKRTIIFPGPMPLERNGSKALKELVSQSTFIKVNLCIHKKRQRSKREFANRHR